MMKTEEPLVVQPQFDDLVAKYRTMYGEEWGVSAPSMLIAPLQKACNEKNLAFLLSWLLPTQNTFSREVFTRMTGIRLPKTQRGQTETLKNYVGVEGVNAYDQAQKRQQEQRQHDRENRKREEVLRELQSQRIRYQGSVVTMDVYIQKLIKEGYTRLEQRKRGAANDYILWNDQTGTGTPFRRRSAYDYIVYLLSQEDSGSDDEENSPLPTVTDE